MAGLDNPWEYKDFWGQFGGQFKNETEIEFFDDQIAEWFGIYGVPMHYYPVKVDVNSDRVFGEDQTLSRSNVRLLTGIIEGGAIDENLIFIPYGQSNKVEFVMFVHQQTVLKQIGRRPLPNDQFTFKNDITTQIFEVNHVDETTLGAEGNFFGHRGAYVLTCMEREISQPVVGDGQRYGYTDLQGNIFDDAPEDVLVGDGSGRIREKYKVPGIQNIDGTLRSDSDFIEKVTTGKNPDGTDALPKGRGIIFRPGTEKPDWGDW
jgi:hypothetical protein